jgi:5'-3' exonuclease
MGIPSYFSFIVKNYPAILKNIDFFNGKNINNLCLDSNSIIYDSISRIINDFDKYDIHEFEDKLIQLVISKIEEYILFIKPKDNVYIAFDGVPPYSKMKQQRSRRYRSFIMPTEKSKWNRNKITPGTDFMNLLSDKINQYFNNKEKKFFVKNIIISCSDKPGEGEHKLMKFIREADILNDITVIYGLDSDLIMLSIFHSVYCKNIFVFREAPAFLNSSIPKSIINEDSIYFLDVSMLMTSILSELQVTDQHRVFDYVFFCFFLGNDFLPHFPALNIRTTGFNILYNAYTKLFKNTNNYLIKKNFTIDWIQVNKYIKYISNIEEKVFINEYESREKFENKPIKYYDDVSKIETFIDNIPIKYRMVEKTINPTSDYWQRRYYKYLFGKDTNVKDICLNYIDGLVWVLNYYIGNTQDFTYIYNYDYAPLLNDLKKYFPHFSMDTPLINNNDIDPFKDTTVLAYVLPITDYNLIPKNKAEKIKNTYSKFFKEKYDIKWAYVRHMWEAHIDLPNIPVSVLREWDDISY